MELPTLRVNHFPLKRELRVARSSYRHAKPRGYCTYLRSGGWNAFEESGQVIVYHAEGANPDEKRHPIARQVFSASDSREQYSRGINALIGQLLHTSGFICAGPRQRREYISRSDHVHSLVVAERGPHLPLLNARAHLRWTWDLEWSEGSFWLVPLPGRRFVTAQEPPFPSVDRWLRERLAKSERIEGIDLNTGRHQTLAPRGELWGTEMRGAWQVLHGDGWRVCLDMKFLKGLGYSVDAFHCAQFTFDGLHTELVRSSPFRSLVETTDPHKPAVDRAAIVPGAHLRFRNGIARDMKEVHRLGVLEHPPRPVRVVVVASKKNSDEEHEKTRHILGAHLLDRSILIAHPRGQESLQAVGASDGRDTIATIWTANKKYGYGFKLPPFSLTKKRLHLYDADTGDLLPNESPDLEAETANRDGVSLIALVLIEDKMAKSEHDRLMRGFRRMKALPIRYSSIAQRSASVNRGVDPKWLNVALRLSQKAGAVPWDLANMPGTDEQTVFVGIDLGHDHARNKSKIAFTLLDHRGRPLDNRVIHCGRNDERIPADLLLRELPQLIFGREGPSPTAVIVHRDGRYMDGEDDAVIEALQDDLHQLTLVAVKKDTCTRVSGQHLEGAFFEIDKNRTILVTNVQAKRGSMPKPIEIELVHSTHLSLRQAVSQVFWLTRVCVGNAFPGRLPATTGWANNVARTGNRLYLEGWEYCDS